MNPVSNTLDWIIVPSARQRHQHWSHLTPPLPNIWPKLTDLAAHIPEPLCKLRLVQIITPFTSCGVSRQLVSSITLQQTRISTDHCPSSRLIPTIDETLAVNYFYLTRPSKTSRYKSPLNQYHNSAMLSSILSHWTTDDGAALRPPQHLQCIYWSTGRSEKSVQ